MKVVFIQPKSFFTWEAINVGYLSAYLKKHIHGINIEFYSEFFDSTKTIIDGCKNADIIGFSVTSPQYTRALRLAKKIKTPDNWIVLGGFHPTNMRSIVESKYIDAIVVGEGERAMLEICLRNRQKIVHCDYIDDLDAIPFVDREVIKQERNMARCKKQFGNRVATLLMGRGCPFNCKFCASRSVWGRKVRLRSPQNIVMEFKQVVEDYKVDFVGFSDDEIGVNRKHLLEFCRLMEGNETPWGCNTVARYMDKEIVSALRSAGCTEVWMGVESGDPEILKDMRKPNTIREIIKGFAVTKRHGLKRRAYCILGMPNETRMSISLTEDLLDTICPEIVGFTIVAPYPGSDFYEAKYKDIDWTDVDEYTNDLTMTAFLSNEQLKAEQNRLTDKYSETLTFRNKE